MRMTELSTRSGLSVPTIKYYKREGLLPPGRATCPNQIDYEPGHVERLRLIRVLTEVAGLPLDNVRRLLAAIDDPARTPADMLATAHDVIARARAEPGPGDGARRRARGQVSALLTARSWRVRPDAAALDDAADVVVALRALGHDLKPEILGDYAQLARATVVAELRLIPIHPRGAAALRTVLKLTTIYENLFSALRRLAREDLLSRSPEGGPVRAHRPAAQQRRPTAITARHDGPKE